MHSSSTLRLDHILEPGDRQCIASGYTFTEGPLWDPAGRFYFADVRDDKLYRVVPPEKPELVRQTSNGNGSPMPSPSASYKTIELKIPVTLLDEINPVTSSHGTWQRPYQRIKESLKKVGNDYVARVREDDLQAMKEWAKDPGEGSYERWAAEILKFNGIAPVG